MLKANLNKRGKRGLQWAVLLSIMGALALSACGGSDDDGGAGGAGAGEEGYRLFVLPKFLGVPVFDEVHNGAREAAEELGDTIEYNGPTSPDVQQQVQFINNAVSQDFDGIMISANDPNAVAPALEAAAQRDIPTISFDADVAEDARVAFASGPADQVIGEYVVEAVGKQIDYEGEVAFMSSTPDAPNQNAWLDEARKTLEEPKYSGMEVVETVYGEEDDEVAAQEMRGLLQRFPNLSGVMALTLGGAPAARVIEDAGLCDQIAVVALATPDVMRPAIDSGCIQESAIWSFHDQGYLATYMTHLVLEGELTGEEGERFTAGRLGELVIGPGGVIPLEDLLIFTEENVGDFNF